MTESSGLPELSAEDAKLVTLARATRARTGAPVAAAVRDLDGRTYAAASVDMPSLQVSALGVCVAMAVLLGLARPRGGRGDGRWPRARSPYDAALLREFEGDDVVVHLV